MYSIFCFYIVIYTSYACSIENYFSPRKASMRRKRAIWRGIQRPVPRFMVMVLKSSLIFAIGWQMTFGTLRCMIPYPARFVTPCSLINTFSIYTPDAQAKEKNWAEM